MVFSGIQIQLEGWFGKIFLGMEELEGKVGKEGRDLPALLMPREKNLEKPWKGSGRQEFFFFRE